MNYLKRNKKLIILLGLVFLTISFLIIKNIFFGGASRDLKRKSDLNEIAWKLEEYYADNLKYPESSILNPYTSNTESEIWIPGLESYFKEMPRDPINNGKGDVYTNDESDYAYVYISDTIEGTRAKAGLYYILATRLEKKNDSDTLRNKKLFWPGCDLSLGFNSSYHILPSYRCKAVITTQKAKFNWANFFSLFGPVLFFICSPFLIFFFTTRIARKKRKEVLLERDKKRKKDLQEIQNQLELYYNYHKRYPRAGSEEIKGMMKRKDSLSGKKSKFKKQAYNYYYDNLKSLHGKDDNSDTQYYRLWCLLENPDDPDIEHFFDDRFHWVYMLTSQREPRDSE